MNLKGIEKFKMYEIVAGSVAYGTSTKDSDLDLRGIFALPNDMFLSMTNPIKQVSGTTSDTTFYELRRYFELAKDCNPNIIEMLYSPEDCIKLKTPDMENILANRDLFISARAYYAFSGYAFAQSKRSRGKNKWVNNPKPKVPPDKMDFCWVIMMGKNDPCFLGDNNRSAGAVEDLLKKNIMPMRPVRIREALVDLSEYSVAGLEHVENMYRLYHYGKNAKGVFHGHNQQLVVGSIPMDDEWNKFNGFLIYNEQAYEAAHKDWKNYWNWKKERNEVRYRTQEAGEIDYDSKHMQHCMRLLWSGRNILENGKPIVRFSGKKLQYLRDIRSGKYTHEELMEWIAEEMVVLDKLKESSNLPKSSDFNKINNLYRETIGV